jgi:hypothetical protein
MGGKNHQPCRNYIEPSTRLSRAVSIACIELETANVHLEDLLLAEFSGGRGTVDGICDHLELSRKALLEVMRNIELLQAKMDKLGYKDLPSLHKIDLEKLGQKLADMGMVDKSSWDVMSSTMIGGSFYANLARFKDRVLDLVNMTVTLNTTIVNLRASANEGRMNVVLEGNMPGNIRVDFARLYSSWSDFNREFLASSILSTEVWYNSEGFGSLTGSEVPLIADQHQELPSYHTTLVH